MLTTINALEESRPRFSTDLRGNLAEMVARRPGLPTKDFVGNNFLMELIPLILFVDEGLTYLNQSLKEFEQLNATLFKLHDFYKTTRMNFRLKHIELSPVVVTATQSLNVLRTPLLDGLFHGNPNARELAAVLTSLNNDLLAVTSATRALATAIIHPVIDDSEEVKVAYLSALGAVKTEQFNQELKSIKSYKTFLDTDNHDSGSVINPQSLSQIWSLDENGLSSLLNYTTVINPILVEAVADLLDQTLSIRSISRLTPEVKTFIKEEGQRIKKAWELLIKHLKVLIATTLDYLKVQDETIALFWATFQEIIESDSSPVLKTLLHVSVTQIIEEK